MKKESQVIFKIFMKKIVVEKSKKCFSLSLQKVNVLLKDKIEKLKWKSPNLKLRVGFRQVCKQKFIRAPNTNGVRSDGKCTLRHQLTKKWKSQLSKKYPYSLQKN